MVSASGVWLRTDGHVVQLGYVAKGMQLIRGNIPTAVVQTVGAEAPFKQGDVQLGVAYVAYVSIVVQLMAACFA